MVRLFVPKHILKARRADLLKPRASPWDKLTHPGFLPWALISRHVGPKTVRQEGANLSSVLMCMAQSLVAQCTVFTSHYVIIRINNHYFKHLEAYLSLTHVLSDGNMSSCIFL